MFKNSADFELLKTLDIPTLIANNEGVILWYNHSSVDCFGYDGNNCNFYTENYGKDSANHHCKEKRLTGCVMRSIREELKRNPEYYNGLYQNDGEMWKVTAKAISNENILIYCIRHTEQRIAELMLKKYIQSSDSPGIRKEKSIDKIFGSIDLNEVFKTIVEKISTPVIIFHKRRVEFINESYVRFAGTNIKFLADKLRSEIDNQKSSSKEKPIDKISFQYSNKGKKSTMECMVIRHDNNNTHAVVLL